MGQLTPEALRAWLTLLRTPGLGAVGLAALLGHYGSPDAALSAGVRRWRELGITVRGTAVDDAAVERDLAWLALPRHHLVTVDDARYPGRLRSLPDAPPALFVLGDPTLLAAPQIAVVGARSATAQGRENARAFAAGLARGGFVVTSGLALGIDGAAHRGALDAAGATLAVCGNGLDRVYPARHRELAHAIAESGALVSEFPLGTPPRAENFPRRNRIISGLSRGVLVVEAARASGSLITARLAAEQGREVFAVPGSIHNPLSSGCHVLIRDGARLVESVADIFEELGLPAPEQIAAAAASAPADPLQARMLEAIGHDAVAVETLVERLNVPAASVQEALLALELEGRISVEPGDRVRRLDSTA